MMAQPWPPLQLESVESVEDLVELHEGAGTEAATEGGAEPAAHAAVDVAVNAAEGTAEAAALLMQADAEGADAAGAAARGFGPRRVRRPSDSMHDAQELP